MAKLVKIANGNRHPKADLNVEIAHLSLDGPNYTERLDSAFHRSMQAVVDLSIERYQFRVTYCILVDDKRQKAFDRERWFKKMQRDLPKVFQQIDYLSFESDLNQSLSAFYNRLKPSKQNAIKNRIERYLSAKKKTACSHDIALWHALRLGILGGRGMPVYELIDCENQNRLRSSFIAKDVASILPESDRNHEEDAETEILQHLDGDDWKRIKRHYY